MTNILDPPLRQALGKHHSRTCRDGLAKLPKRAPADVALAEVLVVGRLLDQPVDLLRDVESLVAREVSAGQLVPHALDYV